MARRPCGEQCWDVSGRRDSPAPRLRWRSSPAGSCRHWVRVSASAPGIPTCSPPKLDLGRRRARAARGRPRRQAPFPWERSRTLEPTAAFRAVATAGSIGDATTLRLATQLIQPLGRRWWREQPQARGGTALYAVAMLTSRAARKTRSDRYRPLQPDRIGGGNRHETG
jgi:hypothetical protein